MEEYSIGRKRIPGLYKRRETWNIDKQIFGQRICESTGTDNLEETVRRYLEQLRASGLLVLHGRSQNAVWLLNESGKNLGD